MTRLLVLNFFPAFFPPSSGGEQRYFHVYHHLSRRYDVTLLSPTFPHQSEEVEEFNARVREHRIPKERIHVDLHRGLDAQFFRMLQATSGHLPFDRHLSAPRQNTTGPGSGQFPRLRLLHPSGRW
jgi:hypothetical protein